MMRIRCFRKSNLIGLGCLLLFVFTVTKIAHADAEKSLAKETFMKGVSLFSSDDYMGALDAFDESYRLSPKIGTLFNIAMCYKALYRYVDAIEAFRRFLGEVARDKHPAKVEKAEAALHELDELTGKLVLVDAPIGASVAVDNHPVGKVPLKGPLILDPGRYRIRVSKVGFETLSTGVTLASGAMVRLRASLQSKPIESSEPLVKHDLLPTEPPAESAIDENSDETSPTLFVLSLVSAGLGIASLGAGAYFNYQREVTDIDDARAAVDPLDYDRIIERGKEHERALAICYSIGGSLVVTGIILYLVNQPTGSIESVLNHDGIVLHF